MALGRCRRTASVDGLGAGLAVEIRRAQAALQRRMAAAARTQATAACRSSSRRARSAPFCGWSSPMVSTSALKLAVMRW